MDKSLEVFNNTSRVGKVKQPTYNGYKSYQTWSAIMSIQNDSTVRKVAEKDGVDSFDKLLKQVLGMQAETLHGVDWVDPRIDAPTINHALSEWPGFRAKGHKYNSI